MIKQYYSSTKKHLSNKLDSSSKKKYHQVDRFIPHSVSKNLYSMFTNVSQKIVEQQKNNIKTKQNTQNYINLLQKNLTYDNTYDNIHKQKLLHFGQQNNTLNNYEKQNNIDCLNININNTIDSSLYYFNHPNSHNSISPLHNKTSELTKNKKLLKQPYKILSVPQLKDDFYLNLLDWSDTNHIGVGLNKQLYVWSGCQSKVHKIYSSQSNIYSQYSSYSQQQQICSVSFMKHNPKICIGTNQGNVKIFDIYKHNHNIPMINMTNLHSNRIGSLGCTNNLIITGSKDGYVSIQDIRTTEQVYRYKAHNAEISGLKISYDNQMVATGGNDNKLVLFSMKKMDKIVAWDQHRAAVKAIGFNQNYPWIASGGGTADKKIRIFSLNTFQKISQIDTGSQVCNLRFSPISNQLISTHGYSLNQLILWKYDNQCQSNNNQIQLKKVDSLMGHKNRVLYLAGENQGGRIVTGAGDQELKFWKVFNNGKEKQSGVFDLR